MLVNPPTNMKTCRNLLLIGLLLCSRAARGAAPGWRLSVESVKSKDSFAIVQDGRAIPLWVDAGDFPGVQRVANDLQRDVARVTGQSPLISHAAAGPGANAILIGTIGKSPLIDKMIQDRKMDVTGVAGQWESFLIQVVSRPLPGVAAALVIAGSDKRGTIYGIYELSGQIGVSPWYYWADVPVEHRAALFINAGRHAEGPPSVKYRGIFLNDESARPDAAGCARNTARVPVPGNAPTGQLRHGFYTNLFRVDSAPQRQLPLARHVEQPFQRGRSGKPPPGR